MPRSPRLVARLLILLFLTATPSAGQPPEGELPFLTAAASKRDASDWGELERLSMAELGQDPESHAARAFLAVARGGKGDFAAMVEPLLSLREAGVDVDRTIRGFGVPMEAMIERLNEHAWANLNPEFNRGCFGPLFAAFPDSRHALLPASRLLMASLVLGDVAETRRLEAWFEKRHAEAEPGTGSRGRASVARYWAQACVRARVGSDRVLALAREAYEAVWNDALEESGALDRASPDAAVLEACDLASDHEYSLLAEACVLGGRFEPDVNPLAVREAAPGVTFEDVTVEMGLDGVSAARVAVGDIDDDGFPDLSFSGALFRNESGRRFTPASEEKGALRRGSSSLFLDFDGDGALDLLVPHAPHPFLLRNTGRKGGHRFEDVTDTSGLSRLTVEAAPEGAAVADFDGDGWLDFYLAVYEGPMAQGHPDLLVHNAGDGTFADVSEGVGIRGTGPWCGRGVAVADFDGDGDPDVHVSNYRLNPNGLLVNDGKGRFEDRAPSLSLQGAPTTSVPYYGHTIGSCFGDIDNDGDLDLFTANLAHPRFVSQGFSNLSMLYVSSGGDAPAFTECRRERGIRFQETHSDPAFVDIDNDGDLDLSLTCIYEGVPSALYQNDGKGHFTPITFRSRLVAFNTWGQAWFDLEGDGDLDCLLASSGGVRLFRNRGNDHHWLTVRLLGRGNNRHGVGARVVLETGTGDAARRQVREVTIGRGTTSQDDLAVHFGLGDHSGSVQIAVTWPDTGNTETMATTRLDRIVTVKQVRTARRR